MDPLMWSCPVEVRDIPIEHTLELLIVEDQQVVKAFVSHAPQKAFANRVSSGSVIWCFKNPNRTRCRHPSKTGPKFTIVITYQILRCLPIGRGFSQLLRHPGIGRGSSDSDMDHPSCLELDDEESEEQSKEKISHLLEVTGPDLRHVIV